MSRTTKPHHDISPFKNTPAKLLAAARNDLNQGNRFPKGSAQASRVAARIGMLNAQLGQFDASYRQLIEGGRSHIAEFDAAIAQSPCQSADAALAVCDRERSAEKAYQAAKAIVQSEITEIAAGIQNDEAAMQQVLDAANAHAFN